MTVDALTALRGRTRLRCPCGALIDMDYSLAHPAMWCAEGFNHGTLACKHNLPDVVFSDDCLPFEDYDDDD